MCFWKSSFTWWTGEGWQVPVTLYYVEKYKHSINNKIRFLFLQFKMCCQHPFQARVQSSVSSLSRFIKMCRCIASTWWHTHCCRLAAVLCRLGLDKLDCSNKPSLVDAVLKLNWMFSVVPVTNIITAWITITGDVQLYSFIYWVTAQKSHGDRKTSTETKVSFQGK